MSVNDHRVFSSPGDLHLKELIKLALRDDEVLIVVLSHAKNRVPGDRADI